MASIWHIGLKLDEVKILDSIGSFYGQAGSDGFRVLIPTYPEDGMSSAGS